MSINWGMEKEGAADMQYNVDESPNMFCQVKEARHR